MYCIFCNHLFIIQHEKTSVNQSGTQSIVTDALYWTCPTNFLHKSFVHFSVFGFWQLARNELHVHGQGYWRVLRGPGDLVPDVPRVHGGPKWRAHGHQVPLPQWHCLWSGQFFDVFTFFIHLFLFWLKWIYLSFTVYELLRQCWVSFIKP